MFSGLVRDFAKVIFFKKNLLRLESTLTTSLGDSIAVNGACLTVVNHGANFFDVELSDNTIKSIAVENLKGLVHVESALKLNDGLHGHIVQGHIDGIGTIVDIKKDKIQTIFRIETERYLLLNIINKGSICIDGISLTVNDVSDKYFELVLIPHTLENTLLNIYKIGRRVNIETDVIVRSIVHVIEKIIGNKEKQNIQDIYDRIALSY